MKPATPSSGVVARPALTLSFFATGFVSLFLVLCWIGIRPETLMGSYYQPALLALVHAVVLGWLGSIFIGAAYQLGPVIAERSLRWPCLGWVNLGLHLGGFPIMVHGFGSGDYHWVLIGGSCVSAGFLLFIVAQVGTASSRWRADAVGCSLVIAWFWLAITLAIGLYMAWSRVQGVGMAPSPWLRAHAIVGLIGFFLTVFNAVSLRLVPMFAVTEVQSKGRIWGSLIVTQIGLQIVTPGVLSMNSIFNWTAALLLFVGQSLFVWEIVAQLLRRHRKLDAPLKWFVLSVAWLPAALAGLLLLLVRLPWNFINLDPAQGAVLVVAVFLAGCLTTAILGMSFKIVPFLVWQGAYARHLGRRRTPMLSDLVSPILFRVSVIFTNGGTVGLVVALALQSSDVLRWTAFSFAVGLLAVMVNYAMALKHFWKPRLETLQRSLS
ncbi:hypothetical protein G0Q06_01425 [Puniceicoccales bacterium CK1056]|uniref:Uncharacterized protein n=1 Tax=Oceanipulchritudo coccoides TaxID=2706888 RepID=A0A6B2LXT2_9BACT|nr:hypothetical protein [Oceanipulchritudo coccoides]NDV61103.1 hypothetical protein [Oceanipulchritudo coccoides]